MKSENKSGVNKTRVITANTFLLILLTGLTIWAIRTYFNLGNGGYTEDAQIEEFISPINSKVQGYIKKVGFTEHQKVEKGDTLVWLDDSEISIQVAQAEAAYMNAVAAKEIRGSKRFVNTPFNRKQKEIAESAPTVI